ncbi:MAG: ComEC/Rec2 family competence protein [Cyanobacteria bacterium P01_A01_bin.135]
MPDDDTASIQRYFQAQAPGLRTLSLVLSKDRTNSVWLTSAGYPEPVGIGGTLGGGLVNPGYVVCLAYLAGLLISGFAQGWLWALGVGAIATLLLPWLWRDGPRRGTLLLATATAIAAGAYLQARTPSPSLYNVNHWVSSNAEVTCVSGTLADPPQLTRRGQLKTVLSATAIQVSGQVSKAEAAIAPDDPPTDPPNPVPLGSLPPLSAAVPVTGRLYLTLPLLQGTGLYPQQPVRACGQLYAPRPAMNPAGFDFAAYLARQGIFAGLSATDITPTATGSPPLGWQLRQRIVRALVEPLSGTKGVLLSAMVLGRRAVDLPYDVRDAFAQAGLAHTLAASGFHVSLLLGLFLAVTQRLSARLRLWLGVGLLLGYAGLTGLQPSICRAVAMGGAGLWGAALERKTRPVALLLAIAVGILLINPIWIWDLGFQLSFLATLGLLVTVGPLTQQLDWLPTPVATALAVPIAAIAWTLPVQLWAFSTLSPYTLPLNVVVTPLVSLISLVGMASAAVALIMPLGASAIVHLVDWPLQLLMASIDWVNQLPGRSIALGQSLLQVGLIYAAFAAMAWLPRRRMLLGGLAVALLLVPGWWVQRQLMQVTVLAGRAPVVVVQDQGRVGLVGVPSAAEAAFGLRPFLQRQGVNRLDWAIDLREPSTASVPADWGLDIPIGRSYPPHQNSEWGAAATTLGNATVRLRNVPRALELTLQESQWLIVGDAGEALTATDVAAAASDYTLVWSGGALPPEWLPQLRPTAAIATSDELDPATESQLATSGTAVQVAGREGAVQWRPGQSMGQLVAAEVD